MEAPICFLGTVVDKATDWLIDSVVQNIGYWYYYKRNIKSLDKESDELENIRIGVQQGADAARRNLQVRRDVDAWLTKVDTATADVADVTRRIDEVERGCFYGWCPKLKSRYSLSKRAKEITLEMIQLQTEGKNYPVRPDEIEVTPINNGEEFDSRKEKEKEVMEALKNEVVTIIGICGMGGVGKSTLAQNIRARAKLDGLFDYAVLVTVRQQPDLKEIQGDIAKEVGLTLEGNNLLSRGDRLRTRLMDKNSRVLVILDDVWEALDLNKLGIPSVCNHNCQCKVILTTRDRNVCETMDAPKIIGVEILSEDEAWNLFRRKSGNSGDDPSLLNIAKAVANECKGLPLAIITVAGALKGKSKPSWEDALAQLQSAEPTNIPGVLKKVYNPLRLSYDQLEYDEIKYLFLLCSLFEEDSDIFPEQLLGYGMGLGIFSEIGNLEKARNRLCSVLETLKDRFLLSEGSEKNYVKMHDVLRDVAFYIASEGEHVFMVSHTVKSEEFPRKNSYEKYNHMSIVARKFDALSTPVVCPKLKLLMLKLLFDESFNLQDDFFNEMTELNVLSLSGRRWNSPILLLPSSIKRLSNLKTLCISDFKLDDISIIGELVNLEILSIRDSYLQELPVEIGKLTNLIKLEYWTEFRPIERISPGVLSRLVRLEELHLVGVNDSSDSILSELKSLTKLTALTLELPKYSKNVIYNELRLSSELTRYNLSMGNPDDFFFTSCMDTYNRIINLKVTETIPLGEWICDLLRKSEFVSSTGKGSISVLTVLQQDKFQNVKVLWLKDVDSLKMLCQNNIHFPKLEMLTVWRGIDLQYLFCISLEEEKEEEKEEEISHMVQVIKFPNLYELELKCLECLTHFCSETVEGIEFPLLRKMILWELKDFRNFWPTAKDSNPLFHEKVSCPYLEELSIMEANISALCSHQLPTAYFSKLKELEVWLCPRLRNLMSPSVARGLRNLETLDIGNCESMEEVITEEGEEIMTNEPLFPLLEGLKLWELPKLGHFFLTKHALEFPILREVDISDCPEMKTFVPHGISVSTPSHVIVNNANVEVDLNKWIQQKWLNYKQRKASDGSESERQLVMAEASHVYESQSRNVISVR